MFGVSAGALLLGLLTFACVEDRQLRDKDAVAAAATLE
jgi:hypothetical protein